MPPTPRRWSDQIDGIRWLPRMIDKARMSRSGTLGAYLIGNSPVDKALLARLGITTDEFVRIAAGDPDDAHVLAALKTEPRYDDARVRRWSDRFEQTYRLFIRLWDLDEGYVAPNPVERALRAIYRVVENPISALLRKLSPAP
jgi:hypothetical protein